MFVHKKIYNWKFRIETNFNIINQLINYYFLGFSLKNLKYFTNLVEEYFILITNFLSLITT